MGFREELEKIFNRNKDDEPEDEAFDPDDEEDDDLDDDDIEDDDDDWDDYSDEPDDEPEYDPTVFGQDDDYPF